MNVAMALIKDCEEPRLFTVKVKTPDGVYTKLVPAEGNYQVILELQFCCNTLGPHILLNVKDMT